MTIDAFDEIQLKTIQNIVFMIEHDFGADTKTKKFYPKYIEKTGDEMLKVAIEIHSLVKYANSIYPETMEQYYKRVGAQKDARAKVYVLEGQYHSILYILDVDDNKYVNHLKHLKHQSNCIKSWIDKDKSIYKKKSWWNKGK